MPQPRLTRDDALLFICDVQTRLLPEIFEAQRLERNISMLATLARRLEMPVVVSEQNPAKLGGTADAIARALGEFEPVEKMRFSAWPAAQRAIEVGARRTVLLCGLESHICVSQTALDLIDHDFIVFAAYDAISSRREDNRRIGWERIARAGALPTSTEAAIYELLGEAGTDDFRALLELIK